MTSEPDAVRNPGDRKIRVGQPQKHQVAFVTRRGQRPDAKRERPARKRRFEPKDSTSASTNSDTLRTPRRSRFAIVDLPAPFGPAKTTTDGLSVLRDGMASGTSVRCGWTA